MNESSWSEAEPLAEPIVAWRLWDFLEGPFDEWMLCSMGERWPKDGPMIATCIVSCSESPTLGNSRCVRIGNGCGIYAVKSKKDLPPLSHIYQICGQVILWGRVVEHKNGYRAQYAQPLALYTNPYSTVITERVHKLGEAYGIPVIESKRSWFETIKAPWTSTGAKRLRNCMLAFSLLCAVLFFFMQSWFTFSIHVALVIYWLIDPVGRLIRDANR